MTHIFHKCPSRIVAQFRDETQAETVCEAINDAVFSAAREVDTLFEAQGGVANIADVARIYQRYGFRNESGWQQYSPVLTDGQMVVWEIPEGMDIHEAEQLIAAFGAISLSIENDGDDELLRQVPHPAALFLSELDETYELEEEEHHTAHVEEKKTLH
jgi:hypothetical protein